jgi:hypothetical protein
MYSILIVIMALGLFAALLYAGSSSINLDNYIIKSNKGVIESSAMTLATQFSAYENMKGYTLKETDWENELFSLNRYSPKVITGTKWYFHNDTDGVYFCLSGTVNNVNYAAMKLSETSSDGIAFANTDCGAKTTGTTDTFPAEFSVTYWLR